MDPITLVLSGKIAIAILLAAGGIGALFLGYRLYRSGVGLREDGATIETKEAKFHLKTVGSVLMLTSFGWGWLCLSASPKYSIDGNKIDIALEPSEAKINIFVPPIRTEVAATKIEDISERELSESFKKADKPIKINGRIALLVGVGQYKRNELHQGITSEWKTEDLKSLRLIFKPLLEDGMLCFVPTETVVDGYRTPKRPKMGPDQE